MILCPQIKFLRSVNPTNQRDHSRAFDFIQLAVSGRGKLWGRSLPHTSFQMLHGPEDDPVMDCPIIARHCRLGALAASIQLTKADLISWKTPVLEQLEATRARARPVAQRTWLT